MAHRGLHTQLPIVLTNSTTNFVGVPKSFGKTIRNALPAKSHGVVALRLGWLSPPNAESGGLARPSQAFVGWTNEEAEGHYIKIPIGLAEALGLKNAVDAAAVAAPDTPLIISVAVVPYAPIASRVDVDPVTPDDWEILQLHANFVEEELLSQICVLGPGQRFPMWVHGQNKINMQVTNISLVEEGQSLCVRLARNTEVVVAPKLRAKEDQYKTQSLRQNEQTISKTALGYQLRVQDRKTLDVSDVEMIGLEDEADWNNVGIIHPSTLSRLEKGGKWPKLKTLTNGHVVLEQDPHKPLIAIVSNAKRQRLIEKCKKTKRRLKRGNRLISVTNQIFLKLIARPECSPGHIIMAQSSQARCKVHPLENVILQIPRFAPISCPDAFPPLAIRLTPILGLEHSECVPDAQFVRDTTAACHAWQKRMQLSQQAQRQQGAGVPVSDGGIVSFSIDGDNGLSRKSDSSDHVVYFVVKIDEGSATNGSRKGSSEDGVKEEDKKQKSNQSTLEPVHWLLSGDSKVEWQVDKFAIDATLQRIDEDDYSGLANEELKSNSSHSANEANVSIVKTKGLEAYNSAYYAHQSLDELGAVSELCVDVFDRLDPVLHQEKSKVRRSLGGPHPGGVYLCGGRGSGKSAIAHAISRQLRCSSDSLVHTVWVSCSNLRGGKRSEIESIISNAFRDALSHAPALLVFDDLDLLLPAPGGGGGDGGGGGGSSEDAQLVWLAEWIEDLIRQYKNKLEAFEENESQNKVSLDNRNLRSRSISWIATGREKGSLRGSLLRSGLFDQIVEIPPLTAHDRSLVLEALIVSRLKAGHISRSPSLDLDEIAAQAEGYAPADLNTLADRAIHCAFGRMITESDSYNDLDYVEGGDEDEYDESDSLEVVEEEEQQQELEERRGQQEKAEGRDARSGTRKKAKLELQHKDWVKALEGFTPAALQGVSLAKSDVKWSDVGGLPVVRQTLKETLELPIQFAPLYERSPQRLASGILLYGPPGCGKTLLAGAVAQECGLNFISVKGPEVLNKYIGASEQAVRDLFARGAAAAPCIVFFDEFDAVAPRRGNDSSGVTDRVVNQLLTFLDGVETRSGVYVMAATSRPDLVDPALLRPGRLDKQLLCGFPTAEERADILHTIASKMDISLETKKKLDQVAHENELFTGADLQSVLYSAQLEAIHAEIPESTYNDDDDDDDDDDVNEEENEANVAQVEQKGLGKQSQVSKIEIQPHHLEKALEEARPSVSLEERARFNAIYSAFKGERAANFDAVSGFGDGQQRTALK